MQHSQLLPLFFCNRPTLSQILSKLTSLSFQQCKHHVVSLDAQPSVSGGILIFVTGQLLVSGFGDVSLISQLLLYLLQLWRRCGVHGLPINHPPD
jgi:hypothetical protein